MIDLTTLYSNVVDKISLDGEYSINKEDITDSRILDLSKISVVGDISKDLDDYVINMNIKGEMTINDSVTLKPVKYPFDIDFNEKLSEIIENNENSLDINEVLWQNIVLEVPLRFTLVDDYSKIKGDGWKLVSEEDLVKNNPFTSLLEDEDRSD
ncbi:MAG: hypothetical protein IKO78_04705 [Bacilli bacterium]|nr:hypothetical protein [Bacilli bacterium]